MIKLFQRKPARVSRNQRMSYNREAYQRDTAETTGKIRTFFQGKKTYIGLGISLLGILAKYFGWTVDTMPLLEMLEDGAIIGGNAFAFYGRWQRERPIRNTRTSTMPGGKFNDAAPVRRALPAEKGK